MREMGECVYTAFFERLRQIPQMKSLREHDLGF